MSDQEDAPRTRRRAPGGKDAVKEAAHGARALSAGSPPPLAPSPFESVHGLPPGCPVTPLGVHGDVRYYLDAKHQLMELAAEKHGRQNLQGLFHHKLDFIETIPEWLRHNDSGAVTGKRWEAIAEAFIAACGWAGIWDASKRERGRGAWRGENNELIWHLGDVVWIFEPREEAWKGRQRFLPGLIGRDVYPAGEAIGGIAAVDPPHDVGERLLDMLGAWRWRRDDLDAVLMTGWIGAALIGGALQWRPSVWLTGGKGTGKSTLQRLIKHLMGDGLLDLADATPAYIWQTLRRQTLPVNVDELEAAEDNRRSLAIMDLARKAASGGRLGRGSDKHVPISFVLQSCFLFSSVLIPPLAGPDRSRLAILDLQELALDAPPPAWDARDLAHMGTQLRRRLVDGWARFDATLEWYRRALSLAGHSARGADQFGTLLACADVLLFGDQMDTEAAQDWVNRLHTAGLSEAADDMRDEEMCLHHLLAHPLPVYRGNELFNLGDWINRALGRVAMEDAGEARKVITRHGVRIERVGGELFVAIANQHNYLRAVFDRSRWSSPAGTLGGWVQALRRLPGAHTSTKGMYFGGPSAKGVFIPAKLIPEPDLQRVLPFPQSE